MQTYSQDLRDRVLRALERGDGPTEIARRFEVSRQWVYQVNNRLQSDGARSGLQRGGYRKSRVADMESTVREWLKTEPGLTLAQLCERLEQHGIVIKVPALWHQMNKWDLSLKKNPARQRARKTGRAEVTV
ncbi:IS630 transposase-related protein [Nevskia soli]|uniref:IS630 transposase-related protein n=1 Tax=Nevskia soli TaxID=418856 RepID=UPI0004A6D276|nr:IS630 transposase-related protein [Nevskia soli]